MTTKNTGWTRVAAGHYRHAETGIEIIREAAHRDHGYAVGVRWRMWIVSIMTHTLTPYGSVKTLRAAVEWAEGDHGFVQLARERIAAAWDEAAEIEALAIAASIPIDGRPGEVTRLLEAAELLNDEHENLAALRHARRVYDQLLLSC